MIRTKFHLSFLFGFGLILPVAGYGASISVDAVGIKSLPATAVEPAVLPATVANDVMLPAALVMPNVEVNSVPLEASADIEAHPEATPLESARNISAAVASPKSADGNLMTAYDGSAAFRRTAATEPRGSFTVNPSGLSSAKSLSFKNVVAAHKIPAEKAAAVLWPVFLAVAHLEDPRIMFLTLAVAVAMTLPLFVKMKSPKTLSGAAAASFSVLGYLAMHNHRVNPYPLPWPIDTFSGYIALAALAGGFLGQLIGRGIGRAVLPADSKANFWLRVGLGAAGALAGGAFGFLAIFTT